MRAAELLAAADLVVAGAEHHNLARKVGNPAAELTEPADSPNGAAARQFTAAALAGQFVVRLYPGDPLLAGAAQDIAACAKAELRFEIVPGVPTHTGVPAYAGIP